MRLKLEIESDDQTSMDDLAERIASALNVLYDVHEQLDYKFIKLIIDILEGNDAE